MGKGIDYATDLFDSIEVRAEDMHYIPRRKIATKFIGRLGTSDYGRVPRVHSFNRVHVASD